MSRNALRLSLVVTLVCMPAMVFAHAELLWPPDRANTNCDGGVDDECKTGPCGGTTGEIAGNPTVLTQGSSITIQWQETIEHPGHYELRLSTNGGVVDNMTDRRFTWVWNDNIADVTGPIPAGYRQYTYTMTVPTSGSCNPCVLQFLQFMSNNVDQLYYSCADVAILAAGAPTPTPIPTATGTPTPEPNPVDADMETIHGGCVCSTTAGSSAGHWLLLIGLSLVAVLAVRRAY